MGNRQAHKVEVDTEDECKSYYHLLKAGWMETCCAAGHQTPRLVDLFDTHKVTGSGPWCLAARKARWRIIVFVDNAGMPEVPQAGQCTMMRDYVARSLGFQDDSDMREEYMLRAGIQSQVRERARPLND
jgi:hypothetical protein